jgi:phosphatidylglycerol:prolipoprotein diacylglycerol transferase
MSFGATGIWIGPLEIITYYGILIMLGALAGTWLAEREARRRGLQGELVWDGLLWVLIFGIVGARLWHVFTPPPSSLVFDPATQQMVNPYFAGGTVRILDILNTRKGGLGIPGAIVGGGIALFWFCRRRKFSFALWADIAVPGVALGQAIGRWGNFINQEVYGAPTDLPWGIYIEREDAKFHPLFLYESIWNFANMAFLLWLGRRAAHRLKEGDLMLIYLITYPAGRFALEFLRLDAALVGGININQTVAAIVALLSAAMLLWRHRPLKTQNT